MKKKAKSKIKLVKPRKSDRVLVTRKMLSLTEQRLGHRTTSLQLEMRAGFKKMDAKFEFLLSEIRAVRVIVEEQNAKNNFVLDGYTSLYDAHQDIRHRLDTIEKL